MNTIYPDDSWALHTDLYQINMMKTYWELGKADAHAVFESYFRSNPFNSGYAVFAGLERIVQYIQKLKFTQSDIDYLRSLNTYPEGFLAYLKDFKFKGVILSWISKNECNNQSSV